MALNYKRIAQKRKDSSNSGGGFWKIENGDTLLYLHAQNYDNDTFPETEGFNFVPLAMHYDIPDVNGGRICLDVANNPVLLHPKVQAFLKKRNTPFTVTKKTKCPVCEAIARGDLGESSEANTRYLFGTTPIKHRRSSTDEWSSLDGEPMVALVCFTVFDKFTSKMCYGVEALDKDITDPDNACLLCLTKTPKGKSGFKVDYDCDIYTNQGLPKKLRKRVKDAMKPGGDCDLFRIIANYLMSEADLKLAIAGVEVVSSDDDSDSEEKPDCFGVDYDEFEDDCEECDLRDDCIKAYDTVDSNSSDDTDEDDVVEEEADPDDEDGEEYDDEDDDSDEDSDSEDEVEETEEEVDKVIDESIEALDKELEEVSEKPKKRGRKPGKAKGKKKVA